MRLRTIAWAATLSAFLCLGAPAQTERRKGPIIRQVDHILIESDDPESLFNLFAATLLLPEAWPVTDSQGFVSGGVGAGNTNIEFFRYATQKNAPKRKAAQAHYAGIAFEPYPLSNSLREMQVEGIPYSPPQPYISTLPKGSRGIAWTTVALPSYSKAGMSIFLYEYSLEFLKVDVRRKQLGNRLLLNGGGPLGIQSLREIIIEASSLEKGLSEWRKLLGSPASSGLWQAGGGPAIRIVKGSQDRIQGMVFRVESLDRAKSYLREKQMLGLETSREASIKPSKVQGLLIRLAE